MNDLKFAFRQVLKNPGFTAVAVITLALGIGANTAIFGFVNKVLLRPPPYPNSDRLVRIDSVNPSLGVAGARSSDPNIVDWQDRNTVFEEIGAFQEWNGAVTVDGVSESVHVNWVTPNLLTMLGIQPVLGRPLAEKDMDSGILLPYSIWQARFAGAADVLGKRIKSDGEAASVVGILPRGASVPMRGLPPPDQAFVEADIRHTRFPRDLRLRDVIARLKPGITLDRAQEEMDRIAAELEKEFPETNRGWGVKITDLKTWQTQAVRPQLLALYGATTIILLIACLSVSNLLLMRGESRRKEFAIRGALGSTRLRLVWQTLGESLLLSFIGGSAGLLLAVSCHGLLTRTAPVALGIPRESGIDPTTILSALAVTLIAAVISGAFPALRLSKENLTSALVEAGRSTSPGRNRRRLLCGLVVGQIAVSTVLLAAAGFTLVSLRNLLRVDPGFARENTLSFRVDPYPTPDLTQRLIAAMEELSGVRSVGAANIELLNDVFSNGVRVSAGSGAEVSATETVDYWRVTTDYFSAAGIPLIAGRYFTSHDPYDMEGGPNVIVNEALARRFFPGRNAVGKGSSSWEADHVKSSVSWARSNTVVCRATMFLFFLFTPKMRRCSWFARPSIPRRWCPRLGQPFTT